jgi:hypothetical protein
VKKLAVNIYNQFGEEEEVLLSLIHSVMSMYKHVPYLRSDRERVENQEPTYGYFGHLATYRSDLSVNFLRKRQKKINGIHIK